MARSYSIDPVQRPCAAPDCDEQICAVMSRSGPPGLWCSNGCYQRINWRWRKNGSPRRICGGCGVAIEGRRAGKPVCEDCKVSAGANYIKKGAKHFDCGGCGERFESVQPNCRYCSERCRSIGRRTQDPSVNRRHHRRWEIRTELKQGTVRLFRRCPGCSKRYRTKDPCQRHCSKTCATIDGRSTRIDWATCTTCRKPYLVRHGAKWCHQAKRYWASIRPDVYHCKRCGDHISFDPQGKSGPGPSHCEDCAPIAKRQQRRQGKRQRRARLRSVLSDRYTIEQIAARDGGWDCWLCGVTTENIQADVGYRENKATIDHVIPVSKFGPDILANVRIACWKCNTERGAADVNFDQLTML